MSTKGRRVITFGTYDLFHVGHVRILARAKSLGDHLTVGVSSDELNLSKKGFLPSFPLSDRLEILRSCLYVDDVFTEERLDLKREYILRYGADLLVMGDDWAGKVDEVSDICEVQYLPRTENISSTLIKERVKFPL
jgi:glycerol-3-phosphate cytidylyltransferase